MELFRKDLLSTELENAMHTAMANLQGEIEVFRRVLGASVNKIWEREIFGFFISAISRNIPNSEILPIQEIKCKGTKFLDFLLVDKNREAIAFEGKMWRFGNEFKLTQLQKKILEFQNKLKTDYIPHMPYKKALRKIHYSPLLFESVSDKESLGLIRKNISDLFIRKQIDFYFDFEFEKDALICYGIFN